MKLFKPDSIAFCFVLTGLLGCSQQENADSNVAKGVVIQPNEGKTLIFRAPPMPDTVRVVIGPHNGSDRFAMGTQNLPSDYLIPLHKHEAEDEILFFHEGHAHAVLGEDTVMVEPGTTVYIPHGVWHSVHNKDSAQGQMVWFVAKPGLEKFFEEGSVPPGAKWTPLTQQEIEAIGRKHGVVFANSKEKKN